MEDKNHLFKFFFMLIVYALVFFLYTHYYDVDSKILIFHYL